MAWFLGGPIIIFLLFFLIVFFLFLLLFLRLLLFFTACSTSLVFLNLYPQQAGSRCISVKFRTPCLHNQV